MIDQYRLLGLGTAAAAGPRLNALGPAKVARRAVPQLTPEAVTRLR